MALAFISLAVLASGATDGALAQASKLRLAERTACAKAHSSRRRRGAAARTRRCELLRRRLARARRRHEHELALRRRASKRSAPQRTFASGSSACEGAQLQPSDTNLEQVIAATLCLIDRERASAGEQPLREDAELAHAAQGHSESMSEQGYFEHVSPDGQTPVQRLRAVGYITPAAGAYEIGENIAWGSLSDATPEAIVSAWMHSPPHRANILDSSFRDSGIGISPDLPASFADGEPGAIYTQDFGALGA